MTDTETGERAVTPSTGPHLRKRFAQRMLAWARRVLRREPRALDGDLLEPLIEQLVKAVQAARLAGVGAEQRLVEELESKMREGRGSELRLEVSPGVYADVPLETFIPPRTMALTKMRVGLSARMSPDTLDALRSGLDDASPLLVHVTPREANDQDRPADVFDLVLEFAFGDDAEMVSAAGPMVAPESR